MTDLLHTLEAEADAILKFVALLKLEQTALENGDTDKLAGFAEDKSVLASKLTELADQRNSLLTDLGLGANRAGFEAWLKDHPSDSRTHSAWTRVVALAGEAHELNRLNGKLIQIRMQHNAQALEALQGASRTLHLYGPDGQTESLVSRRINDAA